MWSAACLWSGLALAQQDAPSVAFYYGDNMPIDMLGQFDWAVVESANMHDGDLENLQRYGTRAFAYVSLGELEGWRRDTDEVPRSALVARNTHWDSEVADLTDPAWADYLINTRIHPLWQAGYRGVFLDTLDSYRLFAEEGKVAAEQQDALVALIHRIHDEFPGIRLILNRGFEVLDRIHDDVTGVAAESLYRRWDPARREYGQVSEADHAYVQEHLARARDRYGLPAIAIDYVDPADRDMARATARHIAEAGFIPWVSTPALDQMGVGTLEPLPRKVLVFYDKAHTEQGDVYYALAHRLLAMPLEYLGYAAEYRDVNADLPSGILNGRYAGVVSWFEDDLQHQNAYRDWLRKQLDAGVRIAMFGTPGVDLSGTLGERLGLRPVTPRKATVASHDALLGFEGMPARQPRPQPGFRLEGDALQAHLTLRDAQGETFTPTVTGPWGGVALAPWLIQQGLPNQLRWILDPFAFLERALQLPRVPIADATTENGSRYWMTQIDGDGFASRAEFPGSPFTGEVLLDEILSKYRVPTTASIIEGEVAPDGLYPESSERLEAIARRIFRLPWIELATHTYSHPFDWLSLHEGDTTSQNKTSAGYHYNLPIDGYHYSLEREITGSAEYINRRLAPEGKRVRTVLWSGDALPPEKALAITERAGLANLNGGDTAATDDNPSLTGVSPMLRPLGDYLQVYAPQMNENIYTNELQGPLWGYRRVTETYRLTDTPRRLKPIDIYYHYYSAASPAALKALDEVYRYVLGRETLPLYASTYSGIARAWRDLGIARRLDGGWQIRGASQARTLRLPAALGWPDLRRSTGVAGVRDLEQGRYVALSGDPDVTLYLTSQAPAAPYLERANGRLTHWRRDADGLELALKAADVPLKVDLAGTQGCRVTAPRARQQATRDTLQLRFDTHESGRIRVTCDR